ncbi:MAG: 3-hydroxybutyrate dehydrogenase [Limibacillus sp.]
MLKGKAALVTGSTSGIGLGMARAFAAEGCKVMLNGLGDAAEIEATRAALAEEFGVEVRYNGADMTKPDQIAAMVEEAENAFGSLDILVNNAGIQQTAAIPDFPDAKWEAVIAINLSAVFYGTKAALPGMQKRGWGRIVNIASAHGKVASPNKSAYVAAKHGVVGLTKVTALENAGKGVTCNAICPGWVRTDLVERQIEALAEKLGVSVEEGAVELLREKQPSLQFVTPEQLGGFAVFLCGPAAEQITGAALSMDGGWTAI